MMQQLEQEFGNDIFDGNLFSKELCLAENHLLQSLLTDIHLYTDAQKD
jgi:hypothetical protein